MKKWYVLCKKADFAAIGKKFDIDPVIARIIRNRDVVTEEDIEEYLKPSAKRLHDPATMLGADAGADLLLSEIERGSRIRVIGDYDIDGICATFILLKNIQALGGDADYDIPDRMTDGYGINERLIDKAKEDGIDLIVTCDNGISAVSAIAHAKDLGIRVIVTDHHEVPYSEDEEGNRTEILPPADVVINPHQKKCGYPFKGLCGAAVAYKFTWRCFDRSGRDTSELLELLDIVALATVGDIMELKGENRTLVKLGLDRFHECTNMGLNELIKVNNLSKKSIAAYHLGFVIGPCINAVGRLDTAKTAVSLLCAEDEFSALSLAKELFELNSRRKQLTEEGVEEAVSMIEAEGLNSDDVLVVYLPDSHESIIGIVAGRLKEMYYKPVIVLTDAYKEGIPGDSIDSSKPFARDGIERINAFDIPHGSPDQGSGAVVKGSGRSIEPYNMFEELSKVKDLFVKFGGHAMAAGMSLEKENVEVLRVKLNENSVLTAEDLTERIDIDVPMPISYVSEKLINQFALLEPTGNGNRKPVFAQKDVNVLEARIIGNAGNVLKLKLYDDNSGIMEGIRFKENGDFYRFIAERYGEDEAKKLFASTSKKVKINIVYYPKINEFNGRRSIQLNIEDYS